METLDRTWQGTEPLLGPTIHELKAETPIRTKTHKGFIFASFLFLRYLWWSHAGIEIPYPALFPLWISHLNPIKTRNPAPTSKWNSRVPHPFSAQISNITAKKSQIPHPAKPIGDPRFGRTSVICQVGFRCNPREICRVWHLCFLPGFFSLGSFVLPDMF